MARTANNRKYSIMDTQELVDLVIAAIKRDIRAGDLTALEELLKFLPRENLIGFSQRGDTWATAY
jgi:hypothetical protein